MKEAPVCIKFLRFCERDTIIIRTEIWKSHSSGRTFIPHGAIFPPCNVFFLFCVYNSGNFVIPLIPAEV